MQSGNNGSKPSKSSLKKKAAAEFNANRIDMKAPKVKSLPDSVRADDHEDILELTEFDAEKMEVTKQFKSIINGRKIMTVSYPSFPIEEYNDAMNAVLLMKARAYFIEQAKTSIAIN